MEEETYLYPPCFDCCRMYNCLDKSKCIVDKKHWRVSTPKGRAETKKLIEGKKQ